ncbi:hypothetical protein ACXR2T_14735 [Leucobacter sp. HY1910]
MLKPSNTQGDLVNRNITYVVTRSGHEYVSFVTDVYSRRIVGWNEASTLKTEVLLSQALDMAARQSGGDLEGILASQ